MRPPLFAGEDLHRRHHVVVHVAASMRPPLFAGEEPDKRSDPAATNFASMRPPLFAGEDLLDAVKRRGDLFVLQ